MELSLAYIGDLQVGYNLSKVQANHSRISVQ
jgi:hypothetical protein